MPPTLCGKRKHQEAQLEQELLRGCTSRGDLDRARELVLDERVNVNCADDDGFTPLLWAVYFRHAHVARFLLENGANADATTNNYNTTALRFAIFLESVELAELLLKFGASLELPRSLGTFSPLAYAIQLRKVRMASWLLQAGAKTDSLRYDDQTPSALYFACWCGYMEIVQLLLEYEDGALVNAITPRNAQRPAMSPLCEACEQNNLEVAQLLVQRGAQVIFNGAVTDSPFPLVHAVRDGSLELVQFLLDNAGFSASANENTSQAEKVTWTNALTKALGAACESQKLEAAQLLVDHGARVNDEPLLLQCAKNGWFEGARFLLRVGANVNQADSNDRSGKTALWIAAERGNVALVKELLKACANANIRDKGGETPLGAAFRKGHTNMVYLLLRTSPRVWKKLEEIW